MTPPAHLNRDSLAVRMMRRSRLNKNVYHNADLFCVPGLVCSYNCSLARRTPTAPNKNNKFRNADITNNDTPVNKRNRC